MRERRQTRLAEKRGAIAEIEKEEAKACSPSFITILLLIVLCFIGVTVYDAIRSSSYCPAVRWISLHPCVTISLYTLLSLH